MQVTRLPINLLEQNTGQIEGLPSNPRQWTKEDVQQIAASLKETPELFEARPIIVYPLGDKYIILGGNLRYDGSKMNKETDVPCFVMPESTPIDKLKEIVIKDNGSFGAWDFDALGNEWDDLLLTEWGVPAWEAASATDADVDALFEESHNSKAPIQTIKIEMPLDYDVDFLKRLVQEALSEYPQCKII